MKLFKKDVGVCEECKFFKPVGKLPLGKSIFLFGDCPHWLKGYNVLSYQASCNKFKRMKYNFKKECK